MKRRIKIGITIAVVLAVCAWMVYSSPRHMISKELHIKIPKAESISYVDSHGGAFGEGETFCAMQFDTMNGSVLSAQISMDQNWRKFPLAENLAILMFGGEKDGVVYTDEFANRYNIPEIRNGFYYFQDRLNLTNEDANLLHSSALNVTISLYDLDNSTLYYLKYDT